MDFPVEALDKRILETSHVEEFVDRNRGGVNIPVVHARNGNSVALEC